MKAMKKHRENSGFSRVRSFDATLKINNKSVSTGKKMYAIRGWTYAALWKGILVAPGTLWEAFGGSLEGHLDLRRGPGSAQNCLSRPPK